jgi:hypothetical protein
MSPGSIRRSRTPGPGWRRGVSIPFVLAGLLAVLAGCGAAFDPSGPCNGDGKGPGAYPELEALVPRTFELGQKPDLVDSGRTCSDSGLGSLKDHGIRELRFAGATFETGSQSGVTLATFESADGPALDAAWLADFYETTARTGKNIQSLDTSTVALGPDPAARRLDVLNDESYQTVVVWKQEDRVVVAIVADFIREAQTRQVHERRVQDALGAWLAQAGF